ncbi:MAG: restriction endonuclease subunit S [Anaerolineaceae bacterium]|jgi:type I restriction enzyme S subunit|nr:restriction endonuclease subunit S [Anaerolineaceae bacterium]
MSSNEWRKYKLEEIAEIIGGGTPSTTNPDFWGEEIPWVTPRDLASTDERFISCGERNITKKGLQNSSARLLPAGTVLLTTRAPIGYLRIALNPICTNQGFKSLIPKADIADNQFLFYLLKNNVEYLKSVGVGTTFAEISGSALRQIEFQFPPLPTQRRIAEILSALDDKIELNRQTNTTLEAVAQAIFKEWFVDFNFPGTTGEMVESELGLIPEGWRVVQLGEVSDLSWGDTKTTKNSYSSEGYIAYSASGPDGYLPYYDFSRDGIVVSAIGAYSGKTWFAHGYWSCIKNTIRFWSTDDNLSNEYLYLYTSPKGFWPLRGSAQPFISQTDAREKRIIYPGNHLARYFGEVLQPLFQLIRRNDDEAFTLSQTRDSLLPKLMNGEIEV